jgi:hypothetical protein
MYDISVGSFSLNFAAAAGPCRPTAAAQTQKDSQFCVPVRPTDLIDCPYCGKTLKRRGLQRHIDCAREAGCTQHQNVASWHKRQSKMWRRIDVDAASVAGRKRTVSAAKLQERSGLSSGITIKNA